MHFCKGNMFKDHSVFKSYFSAMSIDATYKKLRLSGTYFKTKKRSISMSCYGSTITAAQFPKFIKNGVHHILPRPYESSKPGGDGYKLMHSSWFEALLKQIEEGVYYFLENIHPDKNIASKIWNKMNLCKSIVPKELRISNTFFTHMTVLGNYADSGDGIPAHFDEKDIITALFHIGNVSEGGGTIYYDGRSVSDKGNSMYTIPFKHGRIQIGCYNEVLHEVEAWSGQRGCINFNLKEPILDHFVNESDIYFNQFKLQGFPKGEFYAT